MVSVGKTTVVRAAVYVFFLSTGHCNWVLFFGRREQEKLALFCGVTLFGFIVHLPVLQNYIML
jgi:hypothetical protein